MAVDNALFPKVAHVTISLGVSTFKKHDTFSKLFKDADRGLYHAKEHGRNQVGIDI
jgi:diguanylate cyclase (GGDEF)-like protein